MKLAATCLVVAMLAALPAGAAAQKRQRDLITREELAATAGIQTAHDAVRRIHPEWLRDASVRSMGASRSTVQVYLNERREGDASALRNIDVSAIGEIRYIDGTEAEGRFGQNHAAGAILITLFSGSAKDSLPKIKPPGWR